MKRTPLQKKTSLKTYSTLKTKTTLKSNTTLKTTTTLKSNGVKLKQNTPLKQTSQLKNKQKTAKKTSGAYWSIFTDNLHKCFLSGDTEESCGFPIDVHHIFGGANKTRSENYGYVVSLRRDLHTMTDTSIHRCKQTDLYFKIICEKDYLEHHGTKENFIAEFGRWWSFEKGVA